ncbi:MULTISPECIES: hypothetical protein [unclassified Kitasatospora]|uniref:hypothetical protein n=1 Tax=unclassified Kitasatospora TaxID=2633591 RepID=UPI0033D12166
MSQHRENVTWQTAENGPWTIGFWDFHLPWDEEDEEWGVEYGETFGWVSAGHLTPDAAMDAYTAQHPNPGGGTVTAWSAENAQEIAELNALAARHTEGPGNPPGW